MLVNWQLPCRTRIPFKAVGRNRLTMCWLVRSLSQCNHWNTNTKRNSNTGTQGSLQLQQSAADTRVFEFGVVNTKAPGRFYRSHIVHVTERLCFKTCVILISMSFRTVNPRMSSISLASRSAPKAWVWSDHRFLAQSRRIRVRLRSTMIRKSSTRKRFSRLHRQRKSWVRVLEHLRSRRKIMSCPLAERRRSVFCPKQNQICFMWV